MHQATLHPPYWQEAVAHLSSGDEALGRIIASYHGERLVSRGEAFYTLARAIVGQQISTKAADAVWLRLAAAAGSVTPETIYAMEEDALRACGLSRSKALYMRSLAEHFLQNHIDAAYWERLSDEEVIADLTQIKGIGVWTAEMFLIFHLMRPDVFPLADLGLQNAVAKLYGLENPRDKKALLAFGERWRPYRSVATWYFWRSLDPAPVAY